MDRRKALKLTSGVVAGTIIGSEYFLAGCSSASKKETLITKSDVKLLDAVGETILPETKDSPGAREAGIGLFMKLIVEDCYTAEEQKTFKEGIAHLNNLSIQKFSKPFPEMDPKERHITLVGLDVTASEQTKGGKPHFFTMMKQLTLWGYFSSEVGATKALRYNPIPGRYDGCIPYEDEKAWS